MQPDLGQDTPEIINMEDTLWKLSVAYSPNLEYALTAASNPLTGPLEDSASVYSTTMDSSSKQNSWCPALLLSPPCSMLVIHETYTERTWKAPAHLQHIWCAEAGQTHQLQNYQLFRNNCITFRNLLMTIVLCWWGEWPMLNLYWIQSVVNRMQKLQRFIGSNSDMNFNHYALNYSSEYLHLCCF